MSTVTVLLKLPASDCVDVRMYGDECDQVCGRCANGTLCHMMDGRCQNDDCDAGFKPPFCKGTTLAYLAGKSTSR